MSATIMDKLNFNYGGKWSDYFGLISVTLDSGMFEETLVAPRSIIETEINGSDEPIFHKIVSSPLEFSLNIAFTRDFHRDKIDEIIEWLFSDYYKPLYFEGKEDRIYRCIAVGDSSIIHNGLLQGYFTLTFRCNSSRLYSPRTTTDTLEVRGTKEMVIYSDSHFIVYPEISILKIGDGHVSIENMDDNSGIFEIRNLTNLEDIYINCKRETIDSDAIGVSRYDNIIGLFPRLVRGNNKFKIIGECDIRFRYVLEYKM